MIYMSPIPHLPKQYINKFGYMLSLSGKIFEPKNIWMLDNGAFTNKFKLKKWIKVLNELKPYTSSCKGIVIPDVLYDAKKTLDAFYKFVGHVDSKYPIAFVAQNGIENIKIPWDEFDALFIGGDNKFKMSSIDLIFDAKSRGKWVHVGRVNSQKRIEFFWMADSCDGTHFIKSTNLIRSCQNFLYACEFAKSKKENKSWFM